MGLIWGVLVHAANGSDTVYGGAGIIKGKGMLKSVISKPRVRRTIYEDLSGLFGLIAKSIFQN